MKTLAYQYNKQYGNITLKECQEIILNKEPLLLDFQPGNCTSYVLSFNYTGYQDIWVIGLLGKSSDKISLHNQLGVDDIYITLKPITNNCIHTITWLLNALIGISTITNKQEDACTLEKHLIIMYSKLYQNKLPNAMPEIAE